MLGIFKSWRSIRWLIFVLCLAGDSYVFYATTPFTPRSFAASGTLALLLFVIFVEIGLHMRGQGRIRESLNDTDRIRYQVGRHVAELLRRIGAHPVASFAIWVPLLLALATIAAIIWIAANGLPAGIVVARADAMQIACAGFLPLLIAIPFLLEHVSEWRSWQHVIVMDSQSADPQLLISHGVLDYDLENISLERTVTTHVHQSLWASLIAIGDVELHETAGGPGEKLVDVWRPRKFAKELRSAIGEWRRRHGQQAD